MTEVHRAAGIAYREAVPADWEAGGPAALLVHGWPESSYMWRAALAPLAQAGYRAIAPDLPGYGDSPADPPGTWERHTEALERFRRALGLERCALVLHDWGVMIGLRWGCEHPGALSALVVSDGGFFADRRWHDLANVLRTPGDGERFIESFERAQFDATLREACAAMTDEALAEYWKAFGDRERRNGSLELYRSGDFDKLEAYDGCLAGLDVPALVLWGEQDRFAGVAMAHRFHEELPGSELVVLPQAGHFVWEDDRSAARGRRHSSWRASFLVEPHHRRVRRECEHTFVRWQNLTIGEEEQARLPGYRDEAVVRRFAAPEALDVRFYEVRARSALNRVPAASQMPFRWTVNPYRGCTHACVYCFARPTHTYLDFDAGRDFEREIVVKVNAPEVLRAELQRPSWKREHVAMGTNTDPYQWVEGRYRLMPGIWEALRDSATPCSVLTKSPLLLRDLSLMQQTAHVTDLHANLSIPTLDEKAWRATDPHTPHPRARLEAVAELNRAGIPTGVLIAPLMPGINDAPEQIEPLLRQAIEAGATGIGGIALHLRGEVRGLFMEWLSAQRPELVQRYEELYRKGAYAPVPERQRLSALVARGPQWSARMRGADSARASVEQRPGRQGDRAQRGKSGLAAPQPSLF